MIIIMAIEELVLLIHLLHYFTSIVENMAVVDVTLDYIEKVCNFTKMSFRPNENLQYILI